MECAKNEPGMSCRNCGRCKVNRPRGLCWSCYYAPGVKDRYPSTSKFARRGLGNFSGNAPVAPVPTTAAPGTPEKLEVLAMRARLKQALWHPLDAAYEGDPRPLMAGKTMTETGEPAFAACAR